MTEKCTNNAEWTYNNILRKDVVAYCSFPLLLNLIVVWSKNIKFIVLLNYNLLTSAARQLQLCLSSLMLFFGNKKHFFLRRRFFSQPFKETWCILKLLLDIFHVFVDDLLLDSEIMSVIAVVTNNTSNFKR